MPDQRPAGPAWRLAARVASGAVPARRRRLAGLALAVAVAACGPGASGTATEVERRVAALMEDADGGAVVLADTPDERVRVAVGPHGLDGDEQLAGDEAFRIASITKMFTATVALQLAEEGAVDLDAPVADVVPERVEDLEHGGEITLRQLLAHTSGLPRGDPHFEADALEDLEIHEGVAVIACEDAESRDRLAFLADEPALFEPGGGWEYSNAGYLLAGEVLEAVTRRPLDELYRERILDPLEMDDTWLDCAEEPRAELAHGLHPPRGFDVDLPGQGDETVDATHVARDAGAAGGLVSTARDVATFASALFGVDLFADAATLEAMLRPGSEAPYGLGVRSTRGIASHDGAVPGYHSLLSYDADRDHLVVVLSNQSATPHVQPATTLGPAVMGLLARDGPGD